MLSLQIIFIYYLVAINSLAYLLMWYDKNQARNNNSRISERTLFLLAFFCGALGIYLGMKAPLYHKAGKPKFKWAIPSLLVINLFLIMWVFEYIIPLSFHLKK